MADIFFAAVARVSIGSIAPSEPGTLTFFFSLATGFRVLRLVAVDAFIVGERLVASES